MYEITVIHFHQYKCYNIFTIIIHCIFSVEKVCILIVISVIIPLHYFSKIHQLNVQEYYTINLKLKLFYFINICKYIRNEKPMQVSLIAAT